MTIQGGIPESRRRTWPEWLAQPTAQQAGQFLVDVFRREHVLNKDRALPGQIMGTRLERTRYISTAIAGVLELDHLLKITPTPATGEGQLRDATLELASRYAETLRQQFGDQEGIVDPKTRDSIRERSDQEPSRTIDLARLAVKGLHDYPGVKIVMIDAMLALELQHADSIDAARRLAPVQPEQLVQAVAA